MTIAFPPRAQRPGSAPNNCLGCRSSNRKKRDVRNPQKVPCAGTFAKQRTWASNTLSIRKRILSKGPVKPRLLEGAPVFAPRGRLSLSNLGPPDFPPKHKVRYGAGSDPGLESAGFGSERGVPLTRGACLYFHPMC